MHIIQKSVKIYVKRRLACCIHWLPSKVSSAEELNEMVSCKTAISQYVNPEILPVLNSKKQDTKYHQNGAKIRKWLKYVRKKEPHLSSVSNRLFVPPYVNFDKTWTYHCLSRKKKDPCPAWRILGPTSLSHLIMTHFFSSFWQKIFSSWVYKNKNHLSFFVAVYTKSYPFNTLWVLLIFKDRT